MNTSSSAALRSSMSSPRRAARIYGHANARGAEAVGAADYRRTPAFGFTPPEIENLSSAGGVAIRLNTAGQALATPEVRTKPGIVAPDGVNISPSNFSFSFSIDPTITTRSELLRHLGRGSSYCGGRYLILEKNGSLSPDAVYARLRGSAIDMDDPGTPAFDTAVDSRTGFGLVDAVGAFPLTEQRTCQGGAAPVAGPMRRHPRRNRRPEHRPRARRERPNHRSRRR